MNVLAFDTCLGALSVAIGRTDTAGQLVVTEAYEEIATGHAERLMPMVQAAMAEAGLGFADLTRIAVTLGPGTFTGVRTGIAAARAFRLAAGVEVVGATSLAVMAHRIFEAQFAAGEGRPLLIAVDARRGGLYVQLFGAGALDPLTEPQELAPAAAADLCGDRPLRAAGSGARAVAEAAAGRGRQIELVSEHLEPHAGDLAALAPRLAPLRDVSPLYIRPPDAKPQADKRLARTT
jgi:tRNA threonylcarbamoyladenosine biosynthesis protein TsaB